MDEIPASRICPFSQKLQRPAVLHVKHGLNIRYRLALKAHCVSTDVLSACIFPPISGLLVFPRGRRICVPAFKKNFQWSPVQKTGLFKNLNHYMISETLFWVEAE
jgi:hypothetical protein